VTQLDWVNYGINAAVVLATVATTVVAGSALRSQRIAFLTDARAQWEALYEHFGTAALLRDPEVGYYAAATMSERARIAALLESVNGDESVTAQVELLRSETPRVRAVAHSLPTSPKACSADESP
jgi:hypothetical protein